MTAIRDDTGGAALSPRLELTAVRSWLVPPVVFLCGLTGMLIASMGGVVSAQGDAGVKGNNDAAINDAAVAKRERADKWYWLARAYEVERQLPEAAEAIKNAAELSPQSVPILTASARILEARSDLLGAVEAHAKLAVVDRRLRTEHLKRVALLEQKLGRHEKAMQAGRDLIASAPGNPELYEFFSQLCFQLGRNDEGLDALRRAVRVNPSERKSLLLLADSLSERFQTAEALELYWRAFDKAADLEERLAVVPKLTELHERTNQLDSLLDRFSRLKRDPGKHREVTLCRAAVFESVGDIAGARLELETLLDETRPDAALLQHLVRLCEADGDIETALAHQGVLNGLVPGHEGLRKLAQLLLNDNRNDEASALLVRLALDERDPLKQMNAIDDLFDSGRYRQVIPVVERLLVDQPTNWELLYCAGVAQSVSHPEEAIRRFEQLLALKTDDDEPSLQSQAALALQQRSSEPEWNGTRLFQRLHFVEHASGVVHVDPAKYGESYGGFHGGRIQFQRPQEYGVARGMTLAWLRHLSDSDGNERSLLEQQRRAARDSSDRRRLRDFLMLPVDREQPLARWDVARRLARRPDATIDEISLYLLDLPDRHSQADESDEPTEGEAAEKPKKPLGPAELDEVLAMYRTVCLSGSNLEPEQYFLDSMIGELLLAKRSDEAQRLFDEALGKAQHAEDCFSFLAGAVERDDPTSVRRIIELSGQRPLRPAVLPNAARWMWNRRFDESGDLSPFLDRLAASGKFEQLFPLWRATVPHAIRRAQAWKAPLPSRISAMRSRYDQDHRNRTEFPIANLVVDEDALGLLSSIYELYDAVDRAAELLSALRRAAEEVDVSEDERSFLRFALGFALWMDEQRDEAVVVLADAVRQGPDDPELRFDLAMMLRQLKQFDQSLAWIDTVETTDPALLIERETLVLRVAVQSGLVDRARQSARKLFGFKLSAERQLELAGWMPALGLNEEAGALLARVRRQSGNSPQVLADLMQRHMSRGEGPLAVELAHQLLRRERDESSTSRQALLVLKRAGVLPTMIERVESQLAAAPKSKRLLAKLAAYCKADGNDKRLGEILERQKQLAPPTSEARMELAMNAIRERRFDEARPHLEVVLLREPQFLLRWSRDLFQTADGIERKKRNEGNPYQIDNAPTLRREIGMFFDRINPQDVRGESEYLANAIEALAESPQTQEVAVKLFLRAYRESPRSRWSLVDDVDGERFWKLSGFYSEVLPFVVPTPETAHSDQRLDLKAAESFEGFLAGTHRTRIGWFLDVAGRENKLDELAERVERAVREVPTWTDGRPILALVNLRRGRVAEGIAQIESLVAETGFVRQQAPHGGHLLAAELFRHTAGQPLAERILEAVIVDPSNVGNPAQRGSVSNTLLTLYQRTGRLDQARQLLNRALWDDALRARRSPQSHHERSFASAIGAELTRIGHLVDAVQSLQSMPDWWYEEDENYRQAFRRDCAKTLQGLRPDMLPALLRRELPHHSKNPAKVLSAPPSHTGHAIRLLASQNADVLPTLTSAALDLWLWTDRDESGHPRLMSTLAKPLIPTAGSSANAVADVAKTTDAVRRIVDQQPDDWNVLILAGLYLHARNDAAGMNETLRQLVRKVEAQPLERPHPKRGFTAEQRAAARPQVGLWLIARESLRDPQRSATGEMFARRAIEAARRHPDANFAAAIFSEWGHFELKAGRRADAERLWNDWLAETLRDPEEPAHANVGF